MLAFLNLSSNQALPRLLVLIRPEKQICSFRVPGDKGVGVRMGVVVTYEGRSKNLSANTDITEARPLSTMLLYRSH